MVDAPDIRSPNVNSPFAPAPSSHRHGQPALAPAAAAAPPRAPGDQQPSFTLQAVIEGLDNQQFEAVYQPRIDVGSGVATTAEALVRWRHPRWGVLAPIAFLPALQSSDQIGRLSWMMLSDAASQCRQWREQGLDLGVAVNLATRHLDEPMIAEKIAWFVTQQGVPPARVTLEFTAASRPGDSRRAAESLARLRRKGFAIALDGLRVGDMLRAEVTSALFSEVHIDYRCARGDGDGDREAELAGLRSSVDAVRMRGLGVAVIGVDSATDHSWLRPTDGMQVQGFMLATPMRAGELADWMHRPRQAAQ